MDSSPKISVIVAVRNEERFVAQTLKHVQEQDYPNDKQEILVIDGESDDDTASIVGEVARTDQRVKLLSNPKRLSSAGRNIGAKNATGEIITYVDGHTYIDNNRLLANIARLMEAKNVSVLSRPQFLDTPENSRFQKAVSLARKSVIGHGLDSTIYTDRDMYVDPTSSGATYRREVFDRVGYFDERFDACEDVEFNYRVSQSGFRSYTSLKLAVYYYPRESLRQLFSQMKRYGIGRFRLAGKHPKTLSVGTLVPFLLTLGVPILAILSFWHPLLFGFFLLVLGSYLLILGVASVTISMRKSWSYLLLLVPIYPAIHAGLGYGFLVEMVRTMAGRGLDLRDKGNGGISGTT